MHLVHSSFCDLFNLLNISFVQPNTAFKLHLRRFDLLLTCLYRLWLVSRTVNWLEQSWLLARLLLGHNRRILFQNIHYFRLFSTRFSAFLSRVLRFAPDRVDYLLKKVCFTRPNNNFALFWLLLRFLFLFGIIFFKFRLIAFWACIIRTSLIYNIERFFLLKV